MAEPTGLDPIDLEICDDVLQTLWVWEAEGLAPEKIDLPSTDDYQFSEYLQVFLAAVEWAFHFHNLEVSIEQKAEMRVVYYNVCAAMTTKHYEEPKRKKKSVGKK